MQENKVDKVYDVYEYINWVTRSHHAYEVNREDNSEVVVRDSAGEQVITCENSTIINIIGQVSAGSFKYANLENLGSYSLPNRFVAQPNKVYMLQVCGDSMIDFQIQNGDYVLIRSQSYAYDGDIVVAGRRGDDEVTLKQYSHEKGQVGLIPGNAAYETIWLPEEQIYINGVLIGVLTKKMRKYS